MIWLAAVLCACIALSALAYARAGWELWRIRRSLRTGSMDSQKALQAWAKGMRDLNQPPTVEVRAGWRTWGRLLRRRDL